MHGDKELLTADKFYMRLYFRKIGQTLNHVTFYEIVMDLEKLGRLNTRTNKHKTSKYFLKCSGVVDCNTLYNI